jgi:hypothetical protein
MGGVHALSLRGTCPIPAMKKALLGSLFVCWPLVLVWLVLARQAHPFRVVSDDHSFYNIALEASRAAESGFAAGGIWGAAKGFAQANSVGGPLPAHVSRKRPLLLWVWSAAMLVGGHHALVWTWRGFYLLTAVALFVLLARTSSLPIAALLTGVVVVAPAAQGLLSWMSCATFLVSYPLLLLGTAALLGGGPPIRTVAGMMLLVLALMSREVVFLIVPTAVAAYMLLERRTWVAALLPFLAVALWLILPAEDRSAFGMIGADPGLVLRGALVVVAGQSASIVRNVGVPLLLLLLGAIWPFRLFLLLPAALATLLSGHLQLLLPVGVLVAAALRTRRALPGVAWVGAAVGAIALYGYFASRYAFEPLIGLALAAGPAIARVGSRWRLLALAPLVLWHAGSGLWPDAVFRRSEPRWFGEHIDQRFRALDTVTQIRFTEWQTFAGRAPAWQRVGRAHLRQPGSQRSAGYVWRAGELWRAGAPVALHCANGVDVVFDRFDVWEWNVWYWRPQPPKKQGGIHLDLPDEHWSVHVVEETRDHARCLRVVRGVVALRPSRRARALREWLRDIPEVQDPVSVWKWLSDVWAWEDACSDRLESGAFMELELGRLLLRDDGWLDLAELEYLRTHARTARSSPGA